MSISAAAARRPISAVSGQALLLGASAVVAAVWVGLVGLQSRHAFLHEAVPVLLLPLALWLFFSERYEVTLVVLMLYLGLMDGVVKLASGSSIATLGRDLLLYSIVLGALARMFLRKKPITLPRFTGIALAWVAVCVMQLANPSDISLLHAFAALRQHLEFIPLFIFGYVVVRSERRLVCLLVVLLAIAAANGVVDVIQSRLTPSQLATWGPGYSLLLNGTAISAARDFVSGGQVHVRPPGLGGIDGFGGLVGLIAIPGAIALLTSARRSATLGWFMIPATILTIAGIVTSQSRFDLVGAGVAVFALLALTLTSRRGLVALVVAALVGLAGYAIVSGLVSTSANRYASVAPSKLASTAVSARRSSIELIPQYIVDYPLGAGLGSAGPAAGAIGVGTHFNRGLNGETELTFLLVETGIPGLAVMLVFIIATITAGLQLRRVADPSLQPCLMALTAVLITLLVAWMITPVTASSPTAPFLWLSAGCLAFWSGELRAGRLPVRSRSIRIALESH
jgi:hypothetical protein